MRRQRGGRREAEAVLQALLPHVQPRHHLLVASGRGRGGPWRRVVLLLRWRWVLVLLLLLLEQGARQLLRQRLKRELGLLGLLRRLGGYVHGRGRRGRGQGLVLLLLLGGKEHVEHGAELRVGLAGGRQHVGLRRGDGGVADLLGWVGWFDWEKRSC